VDLFKTKILGGLNITETNSAATSVVKEILKQMGKKVKFKA
jgi:hypothetical protein